MWHHDLTLITHPLPVSICLYWCWHCVWRGATSRTHTEGVHKRLSPHGYTLISFYFYCSTVKTYFIIPFSVFTLLFCPFPFLLASLFLSFLSTFPFSPSLGLNVFRVWLNKMNVFSLLREILFGGKLLLPFLSIFQSKEWELIWTEPSGCCSIECEMASEYPCIIKTSTQEPAVAMFPTNGPENWR